MSKNIVKFMNMMKKLLCLCCAGMLAVSLLAGCSEGTGNTSNESSQAPVKQVSLDDILTSIKNAYGENYLPDAEMQKELFESEFPLDSSLIEEIKTQMPMIGFHPDRVVLIKTKQGKGKEVEEALIKIKDNKIENEMQYPSNLAKVASTQVVREGDYVAFLLVGAVNENMDASDEEALEFAKKETQKAVDAFHQTFKS